MNPQSIQSVRPDGRRVQFDLGLGHSGARVRPRRPHPRLSAASATHSRAARSAGTRPDIPGAPVFTKVSGAGASAPIDREWRFHHRPRLRPCPRVQSRRWRAPRQGPPVRHGLEGQQVLPRHRARCVRRAPIPTTRGSRCSSSTRIRRTTSARSPSTSPRSSNATSRLPFLVMHDGPKFGDLNTTIPSQVLDNLIAQKRIRLSSSSSIQNGGGDRAGRQARPRVRRALGQVRRVHPGRSACRWWKERRRETHGSKPVAALPWAGVPVPPPRSRWPVAPGGTIAS